MEGADANGDHGWERLLEAQSEYIANLQRMLQSACQNAAALSQGDEAAVAAAVASSGTQGSSGGASTAHGAPGTHAAHSVQNVHAGASAAAGPSAANSGRIRRASHDEGSGAGAGAGIPHMPMPQEQTLVSQAVQPPQWAAQHPPQQPPQPPPRQLQRHLQQQPLPADEGAGSYALGPQIDAANADAAQAAAVAAQVAAVAAASRGSPPASVQPASAGAAAKVEEVANEVLRLRLLKSQHEELRAQLARAEHQLRRLSPHAVFQLRSYLERHFREPALSLQEALVRLVECLCAVCRIEVANYSPECLLSSARKLFRDPHSFTSKLCSMNHMSGEEAKGLAPFLLSSTPFKRLREKEVNECYEAFHAWLSAFYLYSVVSDQVNPTAEALERQEWLLRRLTGQADDGPTPPARAPPPVTQQPAANASQPPVVQAPSANLKIEKSASSCGSSIAGGPGGRGRTTGGRGGAVNSPHGRSRVMMQGAQPPPRASPTSQRPAIQPPSGEPPSRSPSPGVRTAGVRPRAGNNSSFSRNSERTSPAPRTATAHSAAAPRSSASHGSNAAHNSAGYPGAAAVDGSSVAAQGGKPASPGLTRVHSERTIQNRSPRSDVRRDSKHEGRKESRSPSPGTGRVSGRASPAAAPPRATRTPMDRRGSDRAADRASGPPRGAPDRGAGVGDRMLGPSHSEGSLENARRMSSAPMAPEGSHRSVAVRTKAAPPSTGARGTPSVGTSANAGGAPSSDGRRNSGRNPHRGSAARPLSPDKGGGAPRQDAGYSDITPRRAADAYGVISRDSARDQEEDGEGSGSDDDDDDGTLGPRRRRLNPKQYEALVRCAQQVVAVSAVGSMPQPYAQAGTADVAAAWSGHAPAGTASLMSHLTTYAHVQQQVASG